MDFEKTITKSRDAITVKRVFGEPVERDGVTVIPVAAVTGGGGGGGGVNQNGEEGGGAGFGLTARPVGSYVIRDGDVRWRPTVDVTQIVLRGQLLAALLFLAVRLLGSRR